MEAPVKLTREEAIAFHDSKIWSDWTHEQICDYQLWQDRLCFPFAVAHEAVEKTLGRPVYTHEFAQPKLLQAERLGQRQSPTLNEIIDLIPEEKQLIIHV